jgi:hypothetical protein
MEGVFLLFGRKEAERIEKSKRTFVPPIGGVNSCGKNGNPLSFRKMFLRKNSTMKSISCFLLGLLLVVSSLPAQPDLSEVSDQFLYRLTANETEAMLLNRDRFFRSYQPTDKIDSLRSGASSNVKFGATTATVPTRLLF